LRGKNLFELGMPEYGVGFSRIAASRTLASATSLTLCFFPPGLEVAQNILLFQTALSELVRNFHA
jgi:hypothetical protein